MGAVYKRRSNALGGKKGRWIYNKDRLHKTGWDKFHKKKYRVLIREFEQMKRNNFYFD